MPRAKHAPVRDDREQPTQQPEHASGRVGKHGCSRSDRSPEREQLQLQLQPQPQPDGHDRGVGDGRGAHSEVGVSVSRTDT